VRVQFVEIAEARGTPPWLAHAATPPRPRAAPAPVVVAKASPPPAPRPEARLAAAAPPRAARPEPAPSCAGDSWVVQVGAFADSSSARAVVAQTAHLERVRLEPAFSNGVAVARVRLGPLPTAPRAQALLERVRDLGHPEAFLTCSAPSPLNVS
jgi:DedD protein